MRPADECDPDLRWVTFPISSKNRNTRVDHARTDKSVAPHDHCRVVRRPWLRVRGIPMRVVSASVPRRSHTQRKVLCGVKLDIANQSSHNSIRRSSGSRRGMEMA